MKKSGSTSTEDQCLDLEAAHVAVTTSQRRLLAAIRDYGRSDSWRADGFRDYPQWLSHRFGISNWAARRYIHAADAIDRLPQISAAFESGTLSLDKVLELCRFASPETEGRLIKWACRVSVRAIRHKADVSVRKPDDDVIAADKERYLRYWWYEDDTRLGLEGSLPADQGAVVVKALDRLAGRIPDVVDETTGVAESPVGTLDTRRADALVAMASAKIAADSDSDRATVVIHGDLHALCGEGVGMEIEGGPGLHPEIFRRVSCDARLQFVLHDRSGNAVGIGRTSRTPPHWLLRELRHRDRGCTFPGCESRFFLHGHHIKHWSLGGETDLDNLLLVCTWHHKLLHEYGWAVALEPGGAPTWFKPGGRPFGPDPPMRREPAGKEFEATKPQGTELLA